jgi:ribose transport system substrate-binding protein
MGVGALNAANAAGRTEGITFVGATNFAVGYDAMERGEYWGSIYQSPVDDAEAALQTALDVLAGEDVPFLNYFDTPKITQENMASSTARSSDLPPWDGGRLRRVGPRSFLVSNQQD